MVRLWCIKHGLAHIHKPLHGGFDHTVQVGSSSISGCSTTACRRSCSRSLLFELFVNDAHGLHSAADGSLHTARQTSYCLDKLEYMAGAEGAYSPV